MVISPLIALMEDQSKQLPTLLPSLVLSGILDPKTLIRMVDLLSSGIIKILFISPERLFSSFFRRLLNEASILSRIKLVVIDEAHCISSWSFHFRADYLRIYRVMESIRKGIDKEHPCPLLCLTATGGKMVKDDICKHLHIDSEAVLDYGWFRKELQLASVSCSQPIGCQKYACGLLMRCRVLLQFLQSSYFSKTNKKQNVIIFVPFRRDTRSLYDYLQSYHMDVLLRMDVHS